MNRLTTVRLAMVQLRIEPGDAEANSVRARRLLHDAAAAGADIVVLPEAMPLGWTDPSASTLAEPVPSGPYSTALQAAAVEHGVHVCSGVVERASDGTVYNAAVLVAPDGEVLLHHRKLNELDLGHASYALGDRLGVAHTPLGTIGVAICADAFAKDRVVTRTLGLMGAQLVLSPSAWAVPNDHDHAATPYGALWVDSYRPVCIEHEMWIAGVSNVGPITAGPWAGRRCIGCSLLVGPDGEVALMGPYGEDAEAVLLHTITLRDRSRPWHHPPDRWFKPGSHEVVGPDSHRGV